MKRIEKVKNQILFLLESEGDLSTNELVALSVPITSSAEMTVAVDQMKQDGDVEKKNGKWTLIDDEAEDAVAA